MGAIQKVAAWDPFWDDAYEMAENPWGHDTIWSLTSRAMRDSR